MWAECCDDGGLKFTDNTKELTYEEALTILFASYNYDGNYHDLILARQKLEEAIEKAKKYDELTKEKE